MLTGMELNFQGLEVPKWRKMVNFFVFFADNSKILATV